MIPLLRRLQCRLFGHPGVFREWEWRPTSPEWKERDDAWTCIRCRGEMSEVPAGSTSYLVARPALVPSLIGHVNTMVERFGVERIRIRGGDVESRRVRAEKIGD